MAAKNASRQCRRVSHRRAGTMLALAAFALALRCAAAVDDDVVKRLRAALDNPALGLEVETVAEAPLPGFYQVQFAAGGPLVYATADGDYFILGDLFRVEEDGFTNLAEVARSDKRAELVAAVDTADMIVFPAQGRTRAHVTVFTDTTCFYCQKLHQEVPELNRRGIEVRYLAYPRGGPGSEGFRQLATAWCAEDPRDALTRLKRQQNVRENVCEGNPVAAQYDLGQAVGVRGTPAILTEGGQLIPGYRSADDLVSDLGLGG